ncbi:MAG TPA: type II secretion system protein GspG [Nannocystis sp.]
MQPQARTLRHAVRGRRRSRGMTLIEILVVLAIIGLIVGGVSVAAFSALADSKVKTARNEVTNIVNACEQYMLQKNDKCPKNMQDLKAGGVIKSAKKDPWGEEYIITCPGERERCEVTSLGPDKKPGGGDDINSWEDPNQDEDGKDKK